jgi:FdhE protein
MAFMRFTWQRRIDRAAELARQDEASGSLLTTYGRLLELQRDAYDALRRTGALTGSLDADLPVLRPCVLPMLRAVAAIGPPRLAEDAPRLLEGGPAAIDAILIEGWRAPSASFFAKLVLQPYAECVVDAGAPGHTPGLQTQPSACPFCGGRPQLSILHRAGGADGGGRLLQCATCSTTWSFRRVLCAQCGEEDERRLGYFQSPDFPHVRVDACDTCRRYLKSIDLTRLGTAVPIVDEVASGALDVWAAGRGYQKIEPNLIGL